MDIRRVRADFTNDGDRVRQADKLRFENDNCIGERGSKVRAAGILIKAGVCSAALALVLVLRLISGASAPVSASAGGGGTEDVEDMGRLEFVELPGLMEVLADGVLPVGVDYSERRTLSEGTVLCLSVAGEKTVSAPESCRVKEIAGMEGGLYRVSLVTELDREFVYSGLLSVEAELGQRLLPGDTIGAVNEDNTLTIEVREDGRPQLPAELFGLDDGSL